MPVQMLMRPRMVVPAAELDQFVAQVAAVNDGDPVQMPFERAEESLDAAVLPGTMGFGGLQRDAQQRQRTFHQPRIETGLVVHPDAAWNTELAKGGNQFTQESNAAFVRQRRQPQTRPAAVIEQPQHHVLTAGDVVFPGQVQCPDAVARHRPWHTVLEGVPQTSHLRLGLA